MNRLRLYLLALTALIVCSAKADEGMWLLQLMQQQHSIDMMKKQGLKLEAQDLYNPNGVSLKDAVGIFGGGCTGEIISPEGLILTNHHCGYASIQQHSSVEHDYLTDGFWATSRDKELPTPGLKFTFIERIEDITDIVNAKIAAKEGDYAMIMGFPGSTSRYLTVSEVKERMESENDPRIRIRGARLAVLKEVMNASDKIRIQYANKYAGSSNYWKNSIGMNKAIIDNDVLGTKAAQEAKFAEFAKEKNNADYATVVKKIDDLVAKTAPLNYQFTCLRETFFGAIEFGSVMLAKTREALIEKNDSLIKVRIEALKDTYESIHNKDYDHEVDRKVAKVLFPLYAEMIPADQRLSIYKVIEQKYKGNYDKFVDDMYDNSIFSNRENFEKFVKKPSVKAIDNDLALQYCQSKYDQFEKIVSQLEDMDKELTLLHKTYIRGLGEMKQPVPSYPDANFTIRLTYGNVKPYDPKDGVHYNYYTTTKGILEKENPEDREFVVPAKLKELIEKKDYGRYALPNGDMPVCFLSTNDITGGNSGSPVLNENGELIGCAFDGNWESLSGDINFDNNLQRCINLDIRYVLFILEKLGNCGHLINEMTIVE